MYVCMFIHTYTLILEYIKIMNEIISSSYRFAFRISVVGNGHYCRTMLVKHFCKQMKHVGGESVAYRIEYLNLFVCKWGKIIILTRFKLCFFMFLYFSLLLLLFFHHGTWNEIDTKHSINFRYGIWNKNFELKFFFLCSNTRYAKLMFLRVLKF